jgi:uncharacterized protein YfaS (alpha-2-macroglobulin family)
MNKLAAIAFAALTLSCGGSTQPARTATAAGDFDAGVDRDAGQSVRVSIMPNEGNPENASIQVYVNTRETVDPATLLAALHVEPSIELHARPSEDDGFGATTFVGDFQEDTRYVVSIASGSMLAGVGRVENDVRQELRVTRFVTRIEMAYSAATLPENGRLPVAIAHATSGTLEVAHLEPSDLAALVALAPHWSTPADARAALPPSIARRLRRIAVQGSPVRRARVVSSVDLFADTPGDLALVLGYAGDSQESGTRMTIVQRTPFSVVLKLASPGALAWVTRIDSGAPVEGARVTLIDETGRSVVARTDARGVATWGTYLAAHRTPRQYRAGEGFPLAVVEAAHHAGFVAQSSFGVAPWLFEIYGGSPQRFVDERVSLQVERGIYRPGEEVHAFGMVRVRQADGTLTASRASYLAVLRASDGQAVEWKRVTASAFGTVHTSFRIPTTADVGGWSVHLLDEVREGYGGAGYEDGEYDYYDRNQDDASTPRALRNKRTMRMIGFQVAEFRAAPFETTASVPARAPGADITASVNARYYYGAPVRGGHTQWTANWDGTSPQVHGFEQFDFSPSGSARNGTAGELTLDRDGNGLATIPFRSFDSIWQSGYQALSLGFEASTQDSADAEVTARAGQTVFGASVLVGIESNVWMASPTQGWDVRVVATTPQGRAVAGRTLQMNLMRRRWIASVEVDSQGYRHYGGQYVEEQVLTRSVQSQDRAVPVHFDLPGGGGYHIDVHLAETPAYATANVWAWGDGLFGQTSDRPNVDLRADKESYQPGETARLLVASPYAHATALVTVEQNLIRESRVLDLEGAGTPIDIALGRADAPNVYVSVAIVPRGAGPRDPALGMPIRFAYTNLQVNPEANRLRVTLTPTLNQIEPGQDAVVRVHIEDSAGRPVRGETTLWGVDEGVLALTGYALPDFFKDAYASVQLKVSSAANLMPWTTALPGEGGGPGDSGGDAEGALRSRFLATAFFSPSVVTDAHGNAEARVRMPDNLTRWRILGSATDGRSAFGSAVTAVTTRKPLQITTSLPRVMTLGDETAFGIVLHNETGTAGDARVTLEVEGATLRDPGMQNVHLEIGAQVQLSFRVSASVLGQVVVRARVRMGAHSDGLEARLATQSPTHWTSELVGTGAVAGDDSATRELDVLTPSDRLPGTGELQITLSPGLGAVCETSMSEMMLTEHFGAERITSALVPLTSLHAMWSEGGPHYLRRQEREATAQNLLAALYAQQAEDGGIGVFSSELSDRFVSSYALFGLTVARASGVQVDGARFDRLRSYVAAGLRDGEAHQVSWWQGHEQESFTAFVLSESGLAPMNLDALVRAHADATNEELLNRPFSAAMLALALMQAHDSRADAMLNELIAHSSNLGPGQRVINGSMGSDDYAFDLHSEARNTAAALVAMVRAHRMDVARELVEGLLARRNPDGTFGNTFNTMWILYAFAQYEEASPHSQSSAPVRISYQGRSIGSVRIDRRHAMQTIAIPMDALVAAGAHGTLTLSTAAGSSVRFDARFRYSVDLVHASEEARGIHITRSILSDVDDTPVTALRVGQVVRIRVTINAEHAEQQVAIRTALPAAFEAVDQSLATERSDHAERSGGHNLWGYFAIHDDRVSLVAWRLPRGESQVDVLVRVIRPGQLAWPAVTAEALYNETRRGRSEVVSLHVDARE